MNTQIIEKLIKQATTPSGIEGLGGAPRYELDEHLLIELVVKECSRLARNTDLEDIEGGDSAVLQAASEQIKEHFGVK